MRSQWIEHNDKKIFYQDFSGLFYNAAAVKAELDEVQKNVLSQPKGSVLILTDMRDTNDFRELLPAMNAASTTTKEHSKKTTVLGVSGAKRKLADLLSSLTGQPLKYFEDLNAAKKWLVSEEE